MKSRYALLRSKRFDVDEKSRRVAEIDYMISDFKRMAEELDRQIAIEQERAGVSDVNHYAYPTFAKSAILRRNNLIASVAELEAKLTAARVYEADSFEELQKIQQLEERDGERMRFDEAHKVTLGETVDSDHRAAR
jgi:flagellar FliJ protein